MFKKIVIGCVLFTLICPTVLVLGLGARHLLIVNSLHRHQEKWAELGIEDYRFVLQITQIFRYDQKQIVIEVQDGQCISIFDSDTQVEITDNFLGRPDTIDRLFEVIDMKASGHFGILPMGMWFSAEFDDVYHYPISADVSYIAFIDGGVKYRVLDLEPLQ